VLLLLIRMAMYAPATRQRAAAGQIAFDPKTSDRTLRMSSM
jgi:hypothetical protein